MYRCARSLAACSLALCLGSVQPASPGSPPEPESGQQTGTISGREIPTAILLEQFALQAEALLKLEDGHSPTLWESEFLEKMSIPAGSDAARRLEQLVYDLRGVFSKSWDPSEAAESDKQVWKAEQNAFNQRKLKNAAGVVADYAASLPPENRSINFLFSFLEQVIQPTVTTYVFSSQEEIQDGNPTEAFKNRWLTFDRELARAQGPNSRQ